MALWHLCAIKICCTRLWSIVRICICECECVSRTKKCHIPLHRYAYVCVCVCVVSLPVYLRLCLRRILWHIKNPLCHPAKTLLIFRLHIGVAWRISNVVAVSDFFTFRFYCYFYAIKPCLTLQCSSYYAYASRAAPKRALGHRRACCAA